MFPKPLVYFLNFSGLFSITTNSPNKPFTFKVSKLCLSYSCFLVIFTVVCTYLLLTNQFKINSEGSFDSLNIFNAIFFHLCFLVLVSSGLFNIHRKVKISESITKMYFELDPNSSLFKHRFVSYSITIYFLVLDSWFLYLFIPKLYSTHVYSFYSTNFIIYSLTCLTVEFYQVVSAIRDCFHCVNCRLSESFVQPLECLKLFNTLPSVDISAILVSASPRKPHFSVRLLCSYHLQLCQLVQEVCSISSIQLVVILTRIFITFISNLYYVLHISPSDPSNWKLTLYIFNNLLLNFLLLYAMASACSQTVVESEETLAIASHLLDKPMNENRFEEMYLFCSQLFHREVDFTVLGLFSINNSLILSIAGIVVTYLTMMEEFKSS